MLVKKSPTGASWVTPANEELDQNQTLYHNV